MGKILKDALVLAIITIVSGALLGGVYKITEGPIAEQNEKTKIKAYNSVFHELDTYQNIENLTDAQSALLADNKPYPNFTWIGYKLEGDSGQVLVLLYDTVNDELFLAEQQ